MDQDEMKAAVKAGCRNRSTFNTVLKAEGKNLFSPTGKPGNGSCQPFLANETRYFSLARKSPDRAKDLFAKRGSHPKRFEHLQKPAP